MFFKANNFLGISLLLIIIFDISLLEGVKITINYKRMEECENQTISETDLLTSKPEMCEAACSMVGMNLMNAKGKLNLSTAKRMVRENVAMTKWLESIDLAKRCSRKANKGSDKCITASLWIKCTQSDVPAIRLLLPNIFGSLSDLIPSPTFGILAFISL